MTAASWIVELSSDSFVEPDEHDVDGEATVPVGVPYWAPGAPIRYQHDGPRWVEARADRREERAAALHAEALADTRRAVDMLPDFGQPVLVGHHSEARHRSLLRRSDRLMQAGVDKGHEAKRLANMASSARATSEVSSDDPRAPAKLRARAWRLEWQRDEMKAANAKARKKQREAPYPRYELTNLGANIRRLRKRADEIEKANARTIPADVEIGDYRVTWNTEANRVQVFSPRPSEDTRERQSQLMRGAGFKWSRSQGCWQRMAQCQLGGKATRRAARRLGAALRQKATHPSPGTTRVGGRARGGLVCP